MLQKLFRRARPVLASRSSRSTFDFVGQIPFDVKVEIFKLLDPKDVLRLRQVCRDFQDASRAYVVWQTIIERQCTSLLGPDKVFLEKRMEDHSAAELEEAVLKPLKVLVLKGRLDMPPARLVKPGPRCDWQMILPGGRWMLGIRQWGSEVVYHDLAPDPDGPLSDIPKDTPKDIPNGTPKRKPDEPSKPGPAPCPSTPQTPSVQDQDTDSDPDLDSMSKSASDSDVSVAPPLLMLNTRVCTLVVNAPLGERGPQPLVDIDINPTTPYLTFNLAIARSTWGDPFDNVEVWRVKPVFSPSTGRILTMDSQMLASTSIQRSPATIPFVELRGPFLLHRRGPSEQRQIIDWETGLGNARHKDLLSTPLSRSFLVKMPPTVFAEALLLVQAGSTITLRHVERTTDTTSITDAVNGASYSWSGHLPFGELEPHSIAISKPLYEDDTIRILMFNNRRLVCGLLIPILPPLPAQKSLHPTLDPPPSRIGTPKLLPVNKCIQCEQGRKYSDDITQPQTWARFCQSKVGDDPARLLHVDRTRWVWPSSLGTRHASISCIHSYINLCPNKPSHTRVLVDETSYRFGHSHGQTGRFLIYDVDKHPSIS